MLRREETTAEDAEVRRGLVAATSRCVLCASAVKRLAAAPLTEHQGGMVVADVRLPFDLVPALFIDGDDRQTAILFEEVIALFQTHPELEKVPIAKVAFQSLQPLFT